MTLRTAAYILFPAATVAGVLLAYAVTGGGRRAADTGGESGGPHRCAAIAGDAPRPSQTLRLDRAGKDLVVGVIADARGADPRTMDRLRQARREFAEAGVDLVLSLGGMGSDPGELARIYRVLAEDAPWHAVAIPGDREPLAAHRDAIAEIGSAHALHDGSAIRLIVSGAISVATFPGVGERSQLVAGDRGCLYRPRDADRLARWLQPREGLVVWAGHAPPRQRGDAASDRVDGVSIGDRRLARAVRASGASLAIHGLIDAAALRARDGVRRLDLGDYAGLAPGPAEALPVLGERGGVASGAALVLRLSPSRLEWTRLDLAPESRFRGSPEAPDASE